MKVVTFGEIMGRLTLPTGFSFRQALPGNLHWSFGGSEANVAASVALLGGSSAFVSTLPKNPLGDCVLGELAKIGVDSSHVRQTDEGRLGLYWVEPGINQRPSKVLYDRSHSAFALAPPGSYPWASVLAGASWFHFSGITPALSEAAAQNTLSALKQARQSAVPVSCDLNFRKQLWKWQPDTPPQRLCRQVMEDLLPFVSLLIANEEDADRVLGIQTDGTDVVGGTVSASAYKKTAQEIVRRYPNIQRVAFTLRESMHAHCNRWSGLLYDAASDTAFLAPQTGSRYQPYLISSIVDRIGAGDAFSAALIFALQTPPYAADPQTALHFAVAASCLCHSLYGDINYSSREAVEALMQGDETGRIQR